MLSWFPQNGAYLGWVARGFYVPDGAWDWARSAAQFVAIAAMVVAVPGGIPAASWNRRRSRPAPEGESGAYVALIQVEGPGGVQAEAYGPEHERQDLSGVVLRSGSEFFRWGRRLRLEVYRHPNASAETLAELDALLASWRFDRVPVGDPSWAMLEALRLLPPEVDPLAFPLRDGRRVWQGNVVRSVQTEVVGDTVLVTFTYRWDAPTTGGPPDDCPPDRRHRWRFEARPSGEVVLVENGLVSL